MQLNKSLAKAIILIGLTLMMLPLTMALTQNMTGGYGVKLASQQVDFRWFDTEGEMHQFSQWQDGPTYVLMGFLSCSQICPLRIGQLAALDSWLDQQTFATEPAVRFLFITIDPENDTAAIRQQMIDGRSPRFVSAQLPAKELTNLAQLLREKSTVSGEEVNHIGKLFLFSAEATLERVYTQQHLSIEKLQTDLAQLI